MEFLRQTLPVIHQIKRSKLLFIFRHLGLVVPSANCGQMKTSVSGMYACITSLIPKFAEGQATDCKQACIGLSLFCKYHIVFAPNYRRKQALNVRQSSLLELDDLRANVCRRNNKVGGMQATCEARHLQSRACRPTVVCRRKSIL